jgi:Cof subfamily protein (haloacid dehalogenase superfamily)
MKYAMIALDVDGTLLNDSHELTELTKKAIYEAHHSGIHIVLCTGRGPSNAIPILEQLGLEGVLITHNGAATVQTPQLTVLSELGFSIEKMGDLMAYCRERSIHFDVHTAFEMFLDKLGEVEAAMYEKFGLIPVHVEDLLALRQPVVKFTMFGDVELMDVLERDLRLSLITLPEGIRFIRSGEHFIDVMHVEANKGTALELLARQWNIASDRIIAVGNYYNDIEMIQFAGLGIAMANSPEAVKEAADIVTLSNEEDGVYAALLELGLVQQ